MANDNHLFSVPCYDGTMLKQDYYNEFFEVGQQKINFSFFDLECKTKFHIHTEFSLTLFFHILYYFSTFYPQ